MLYGRNIRRDPLPRSGWLKWRRAALCRATYAMPSSRCGNMHAMWQRTPCLSNSRTAVPPDWRANPLSMRSEPNPRRVGSTTGGPPFRPVHRQGVGCGAPPLYADSPMRGGERAVFRGVGGELISAMASVTATSEPSWISGPLRRKRSPAASS